MREQEEDKVRVKLRGVVMNCLVVPSSSFSLGASSEVVSDCITRHESGERRNTEGSYWQMRQCPLDPLPPCDHDDKDDASDQGVVCESQRQRTTSELRAVSKEEVCVRCLCLQSSQTHSLLPVQ